MHVVTFIFACIELVILFYLIIYRLARPDDKTAVLNIVLISLLIIYNVTGGLLPDPNLPGSVFIQEAIAYGTGFITPCYFPYYVYKAFGLEKMRFHAYKGVFLFLMLPYLLFVIVYAATNNLDFAKNLLALPVLYALWVVASLFKAIRSKYKNNFRSRESREEAAVLILSITPWIGLPFIDYFDLSQAIEASVTNPGFLLLLALQVNRHIKQIRTEHERLLNWNTNLQHEVDKKTAYLEKINEQTTNTFVNLAHETKTPLTLINNYLQEYINSKGNSEELTIIKKSIDKLSIDIVNFFDMVRFNKGFAVYNHEKVSDFSEILWDKLLLFKSYARKRDIELKENIEENVFIKADPESIHRIINNLVENAIKFSDDNSVIEISLSTHHGKILFSITDSGIGIPPEMHEKVFKPYYQINNHKRSIQGMGLGLPIVKKVVVDLNGEIGVESDPQKKLGTTITVLLTQHKKLENETALTSSNKNIVHYYEEPLVTENPHQSDRQTILLVEDNISMVNYLIKKLAEKYNVYAALNGNEALAKIKNLPVLPDLIITDVMMDKLDGYEFAEIIQNNASYSHIPFIFLSAKSTLDDRLLGLRLGAIDFIQKPFVIKELLQKIESILTIAAKQRLALLTSAFKNIHSQEITKKTEEVFNQNCDLYKLTIREKEVAILICKGLTYKAVAEHLFISERTVTTHVQNIFEKMDVSGKNDMKKKLEG